MGGGSREGSRLFYKSVMSLKTKIRLAVVIVLLLSILANLTLLKSWQHWKGEANRHESNFDALVLNATTEKNGYAATLKLTQEQFADLRGHILDSLNKLTPDKLKPSRVKSFTSVKIKDESKNLKIQWRDSIVQVHDTVMKGRTLVFNDTCLNVTVYEPIHPDSLDYAYISTAIDIEGKLVVYRGKRTKQASLFGLNLFRYGPREEKTKFFTNCGEVEIEHIEIIEK